MSMALHHTAPTVAALLATIPSLPRPVLSRLVANMIDRLDDLDGDPDLEDEGDRELTDEREVEDYLGGYSDYVMPYSRAMITA